MGRRFPATRPFAAKNQSFTAGKLSMYRMVGLITFSLPMLVSCMPQSVSAASASDAVSSNAVACLIEPHQLIKLATVIPGVLQEVLVNRGDHVTKNMLVARLDSAVEAADLAAAEMRARDDSTVREKAARAEFTESKSARLERLHGTTQYVSPTALEEARSDALQAQASLQSAKITLRLSQIDLDHARARLEQRAVRSPVDGIVTERTLGPGEYAYDQTQVMTVAELDPLNVEAYLPIALYGSIKLGETAIIQPEAPVGGSYEASVAVIDRLLDSRSGTFGVRLRLPNPGSALPAGIRCKVIFPG